jgi:hypothetical protein
MMKMSNNEIRIVGPREYVLSGNETWVDVFDLTVHISKRNGGAKVVVYPREDDGISKPLGSLFVAPPKSTTETPLVLDLDHNPISPKGDGTIQKRLSAGLCPNCCTSLQKAEKGPQRCKVCNLEIGTAGN